MKLYLQVHLVNKTENHVFETLWKKYDDGFIPNKGIEFQDEAWGENTRGINRIIVDLDNDYCFAHLEGYECESDQECKNIKDGHNYNGWNTPLDFGYPL